jgi:hypothetical protein
MTREELDAKYTLAGMATEEFRARYASLSAEDDDRTVLLHLAELTAHANSILMGMYAEMVYARHTAPALAMPRRPKTIAPITRKKRRTVPRRVRPQKASRS